MNVKSKKAKNQVIKKNSVEKFLSNEEIQRRISEVEQGLKSYTWRELETKGKFIKNDKISFITEKMLIVGCDIGSEMHYIRAIDHRGIEVSKTPFGFANDKEGFEKAKQWMLELAAQTDKCQIILGLEPTGHYWFALATWLISQGISVVQVNPYAVKQSKEIEDNSQLKDDRKDPKIIANLVKDGNYGMPYLPEDIIELGEEGLRDIWHNAKLRGRGYSKAKEIVDYAKASVGLKEGNDAGRKAIEWDVQMILEINQKLEEIEKELHKKCKEIPSAENLLEIKGVGENILVGIIAEMGDTNRFDDTKEIQKLSGLSLVASSSGKHNGQTRISYRGRKRLHKKDTKE